MYAPKLPDPHRPLPPSAPAPGEAVRRPSGAELLLVFRKLATGLTPAERDTGLCSNCDLRAECAFPVPEGGVWHCEEHV